MYNLYLLLVRQTENVCFVVGLLQRTGDLSTRGGIRFIASQLLFLSEQESDQMQLVSYLCQITYRYCFCTYFYFVLFGSAKELQFLTVCLCWRHIFDKEHLREEIFCLSCQFCQSSTRPQPTTAKYLSSHLFLGYSQRSRMFWFLAFNNSWQLSVLFLWSKLFIYVSKCSSCLVVGSFEFNVSNKLNVQ